MKNFFKDTWNWQMALIVCFSLGFMLIFTIAWSIEDGVVNLEPVWLGLGFVVFVYICNFVMWIREQNQKGGTHG